MVRKYLWIALILSLFSCSKDENSSQLLPIRITVIQGAYEATLIWNPVEGCTDSAVEYKISLGENILAEHLKSRYYKVSQLKEQTKYQGRIEACADGKLIASQEFDFTTAENLPPNDFSITELAIRNKTVALQWEEATDPEKGLVTYDVYLNGQLKAENLVAPVCEIEGLNILTYYSGKIVARDSADNKSELNFIFSTIHPDNSVMTHKYIKFQDRKRDFAWYLPKSYSASESLPLVIFLHGANGNAWNQMQASYFKTIADRENFIFMMPQALLGSYNGESIYQWNAHYIFPWDDAAFISHLIDYMDTLYNIDLNRVYIGGMSNGGFMTFFAARELQDRIAAIAPIAGLMSSNVYTGYTLSHPMPLCYMHGTADPIVNINGNPSANDVLGLWMGINSCSNTPEITQLPDVSPGDNSTVTLYRYSGSSENSEILYYQINGGGHSIPGIEYGANMDINAFEVMWSFFKRHPKQ